MSRLTFKEAVDCTGGSTAYTGEDFPLSNICFDSRKNVKGAAFVALVTEKDNGHRYVSVSAQKGARAAIVSEDVSTDIPTIRVADTRKAYQDIATYCRNQFHGPVVALTGSNGKTTVKDMLAAVLASKYKVLATEKNYNNDLGVPQTLLKLDHTYDVAVVEIGMNHSGEIRSLANIVKPDIAAVTKIGTAHMGNLGGTRHAVFHAKMEIAEGLSNGGTLVLCSDDDLLADVTSDRLQVLFCGLREEERNFLYATDITQCWDESGLGLSFSMHYQGNSYPCSLPVLGRHNVQNALLALTIGIRLGVPADLAIKAIQSYPRSSMRLETATVRGIRFIKDYYNASPDSTMAAIDTLSEIGGGSTRIAVLGDLMELGEASGALHRELAEYTRGRADRVYYVGAYGNEFLKGRSDASCFASKEALDAALSSAVIREEISSGDIVLIKGSNGMKMWEQYELLYKLLERGSAVAAQTRLLVDVDALKHNYAAIKQYVGSSVKVVPVIKADAYSTGANLLADIYSDCSFFAVADLREAEELHRVMKNARFLILYQAFPYEADWIAERSDYVTMSVGEPEFAMALNKAAAKADKMLTIHIEVDTGMSRLGVLADECEQLAAVIAACRNLTVEGIYTHYSSADMYAPEDLEYTAMQTDTFKRAVAMIENRIGTVPYKHACAGAAIFNPEAELFNMVRPGYILRGYYPCEEIKDKITLKPVLTYVTRITQVKEFAAGASISYGRTFVTKRKTQLAEIPVGYSDGVMRRLSNNGAFVIKGQLAPIVGNVTMDYTIVDVTDISPMVNAGDEVAIFDNVNMTVERMAELCGTIGYEIITNIKDKADRIEVF